MPRVLEDRIIWDESDWLAGLAPQHALDTGLSVGGSGAAFMRNVNPYRRLGGIAPGFSPTNVGNVVEIDDGLIVGGDADFSGATPYAYLIQGSSTSTRLHQLNLSTDVLSVSGGFPRNIAHSGHASVTGRNVLVYSVGTSTMAFYGFTDATDGDIGTYDGAVFNDSFFSNQPTGATTLTSTDPHPMIIGDDGAMYVGNGRALLKFDGETGANGTITTAFNLPRGYVIRAFTKTLNYLIVFASRGNSSSSTYFRGDSRAWFWNYVSDRPNFAYEISDNYISAGFNWNGIPGCFSFGRPAEGRGTSTRLNLFTGSQFEPVLAIPRNPPGEAGVEVNDKTLYWNFVESGNQSWVASYGSPWKNLPTALHFIAEPSGTTIFSSNGLGGGLCRSFTTGVFYVSSGSKTSGGLEIFSSNYGPATANNSYWQGLVAVPFFPKGHVGKAEAVRVTFRNTASSGRSVTVALTTDFRADTTNTVISAETSVTATTMTREFRFDTNGDALPFFTSIAPNITWSTGSGNTDAPTIQRIEVFYKVEKLVPSW